MRVSTPLWRRATAAASLLGMVAAAAASLPSVASAQTRPAPRPQQDANAAARQKWEAIITFWGQEDTGAFDLRAPDKQVTEPGTFRYVNLWKYDLDGKKWVKIDDRAKTTNIVLPANKPVQSPEDSQLLTDLPITFEQVGLYYVNWQINGIDGGTMTRIGPNVLGKQQTPKPPAGSIVADVPVDGSKAVRVVVPDPRFNTGQIAKETPKPAVPATRPGK